jgi:hypothetical protein
MANTTDREQAIAEHVRGLSEESTGLLREELEVIRGDLLEHAKRLGAGGGMLGGAGLLALGAFATATAALVSLLARSKRSWRAAALVTVLYGAGAAGLAAAGRKEVQRATADAADSVERNVQAAAEGAKDAG